MPVQFKMVPKQNNLVSPPEVKYYPCAVSKGEEDLDSLATTIASRSTMSRADCYGVIVALSEAIGEALTDGKIIKIDNLGSFQLTLSGTSADNAEDNAKATIKEAKIKFRPLGKLKNKIKNINYKRIR